MSVTQKRIVLGDIANISSGGTPSRAKSDYWKGEIPWVKTAQIQNCRIDMQDVDEWITEKGLQNSSAKVVPAGTILMAMYGQGKTRGQVAVLNIDASINQACAAIELDKSVDKDYIYQLLLASYQRIRRMSNTGGQENLSATLIKEIPVLLVSLSEQKAIADLLVIWDEAIEKTKQLIQAKQSQLIQLSKELLFGRKRLAKQQSELVDDHFFKYPSDWGLAKIGEVAREVSLRNSDYDTIVLSCSKYDGFVNSLDYFGKQVFSSDTSNYKVIHKGQFGYPLNHVEEGSIGLLEHCEKGIVSPIYVVFEVDQKKVYAPYLYKLLKTDIYRHIFQVSTSSSVARRGSLRWKAFSKIKILLPTLEEQQQIAETLSTAQQEIDLLKQLAEKYKTQKRGLMQKLLTGEWRVRIGREVA